MAIGDQKIGFICDDIFYLTVTDTKIQDRYRTEGSVQFSYKRKDRPDRVVIKNWWSIPEWALDEPAYLVELVEGVLN